MANSTINPFDLSSSSAARASRRPGAASLQTKASPDEINPGELQRVLRSKNTNRDVNQTLQRKFDAYIEDGSSNGYLRNQETAAEFNFYTSRRLKENDTALLTHLCSEDHSLLRDHLSQTGHVDGSLAQLLLDYAKRALAAQASGRNLKDNPLPLQDEDGYGNATALVEMLKGRAPGLSTDAPRLKEVQNNSDPAIRLVYQIANHLGLGDAIRATRKSLRRAEANELTSKLEGDIPSLLRAEYNKLNEIFLPDGSLVVEKLGHGRVRFIPKVELSPAQLCLIGDDARYFDQGSSLNFGEFFKQAHALAVAGNDDELTMHVAQGMFLIMASFNLRLNDPSLAAQRSQILEEFKLLTRNIQGKGLIPPTLARVIREKVTEATLSSDFINRASAGHENCYSKQAINDFLTGARGPAIASQANLADLINGNDIVILHADGTSTQNSLKWIENSQILTQAEAADNLSLTASKPISLQRAVEAHHTEIDMSFIAINNRLQSILSPNNTSTGTISKARQDIEDEFATLGKFRDIPSIATLITSRLKAISSPGINVNQAGLETALTRFAMSTLGGDDLKAFNANTKTATLRSHITSIAQDMINGDDPSTNISLFIVELHTVKGNDDNAFRAQFNDDRGKVHLKTLFNACIKEPETNTGFLDSLNLDNIETIFSGAEGLELAKKLEALATPGSKYQDIIDSHGKSCYGGFANLLFAQNREGQAEPEKRLIALLSLVKQTAPNDDHFNRLTKHVIERLRIASRGSTTNLVTQFTTAAGVLSETYLSGKLAQVLTMKDRVVFLEENLLARQRELENLREQSSSIAIKNFGDESKYQEYRTALQKILDLSARLSLDDPNCLKDLTTQIENDRDDKALGIVWHLIDRLEPQPASPSNSRVENPADSITRMVEHIERLLNSRNLATYARTK
jgi:hypothetical protein